MPAPAFDPPRTIEGRRTAGHVQVPDPTAEDAGPLEMSWKVASEGALEEEPNPTKLRRTASIAGNVLVAKTAQDNNNSSSSSRRAYWLQRTITEEAHNQKFVRIGFPLQPFTIEGENNKSTSWTVVKTDKGSLYPFHMVAIKVQKRSSVFPDEDGGHPGSGEDDKNSRSEDEKATIEQAANHAKAEISALQLLQAADPDGKKNVLRALDVIDDQVNIYIILPYCKEGTLLDRLGETPDGRLEESVAKKYFSNILNVSNAHYCSSDAIVPVLCLYFLIYVSILKLIDVTTLQQQRRVWRRYRKFSFAIASCVQRTFYSGEANA